MKKILVILVLVIAVILGYGYMSTKEDKSVKGNEGVKELKIGEKLAPFTLKDQFDKLHTLSESTKKIIFVFKKDTGHLVRNYLNQQKDNYLQKRDILFVADISKMPAMIREYIAMPDLRKRKYPVLIVYNQELAAKFKNEKEQNKIMIVELDHFIVKNIKFITTEEELKKEID